MKIKGILHAKGNTLQINEKFKVRTFVVKVESDKTYTDYIPFELSNDKCALLDDLSEGDKVNVHFEIKGRKSTKEYEDLRKNYWLTLRSYYVGKKDLQSQKIAESYGGK